MLSSHLVEVLFQKKLFLFSSRSDFHVYNSTYHVTIMWQRFCSSTQKSKFLNIAFMILAVTSAEYFDKSTDHMQNWKLTQMETFKKNKKHVPPLQTLTKIVFPLPTLCMLPRPICTCSSGWQWLYINMWLIFGYFNIIYFQLQSIVFFVYAFIFIRIHA